MESLHTWTWQNIGIPLLVLLAIVLIIYLLSLSPEEETENTFIRGRSLISIEQARQRAEESLSEDAPRLCWGGLDLPMASASSHFVIAGNSGSGKTLNIQMLLQSVLPQIMSDNDQRALIYDAKGDTMSLLHGMNLQVPIRTLNPFDTRGVAWDLAKDLTAPVTAFEMASLLIPADPHANQPFFTRAATHLLYGVLLALMEKAGMDWTFADVVYAMQSQTRIRELLASTPYTKDLIELYLSVPERASDILATVATKMGPYSFIAAAWSQASEKVSLKEWGNEESILVLGTDEANRQALDAINRVVFKRISEIILSQTESADRRTWIFLDEARQAGFLDGLDSILTNGRSKGASVVLGFQDIEGMREVNGDKVANELIGQCSHVTVLRLASPATAQWAANLFGSYERFEDHTSDSSSEGDHGDTASTTVSKQRVKREAVLSSEFLSLPPTSRKNGLTGYSIVPGVGAYQMHLTAEWLDARLPKPDPAVPNFLPRPQSIQHLPSWTEADRRRLGLLNTEQPIRNRQKRTQTGNLQNIKGFRQEE